MVDAHDDFAAHLHRRLRHQVERAADRAFGRVLHGHDAEIRGARFDRAEDVVDRGGGERVGGEAEVLQGRALAEGALGPEVRDRDGALEREARRHDLAEEERDGLRGERAGIAFLDAAKDLRLALGPVGLADLERADLAGEARSLVEGGEEALVDAIDLAAQALELGIAHAATFMSVWRLVPRPRARARRGWKGLRGCGRCARSLRARRRCRGRRACTPSPLSICSPCWMLRPACAIVVEICPTMFGTFELAIAMRNG